MPFKEDIRSVTVPGCVDGWLALHERFGRLGLDRVLAPAIGYARRWVPRVDHARGVDPGAPSAAWIGGSARPDRLANARRGDPEVGRRPLPSMRSSPTDAAGFYEGEFGEGLLKLGNGEYAAADLASPGARWVDPISVEAFGHILWGIPPSSQGYLLLSSTWIADGLPLPDDPDDPLWAHLLIEASKQAGHDRPAVLHDAADGDALL